VLSVLGGGGTRRWIAFGVHWEEGGDVVYEIRGGDTVGGSVTEGEEGRR
jgi:hypothetical protein